VGSGFTEIIETLERALSAPRPPTYNLPQRAMAE
jgi:hypothetical protein